MTRAAGIGLCLISAFLITGPAFAAPSPAGTPVPSVLCAARAYFVASDQLSQELSPDPLTGDQCLADVGLPTVAHADPPTYASMGITLSPDVLASMCAAPIVYPEPAADCGGDNENPLFGYLQSGLKMKFARIFAPYDSITTSNATGTGCVNDEQSSDWPSSVTPAYEELYDRLVAAEAAGLIPVIALTPAGNAADSLYPDPTDPPKDPHGNEQYRCGLAGLLTQVAAWQRLNHWPYPVDNWEAFNEPDVTNGYQGRGPHAGCGPSFGIGVAMDGAGKAACLWEIAEDEDHALGRYDAIAAGSFNYGSAGDPKLIYVKAYTATLQADSTDLGRALPFFWAFHPYYDVIDSLGCTAIGAPGCVTANLANFVNYLNSVEPSYNVWLSELSDVLTDPGGADLPNATDDNPTYQADAAEGFLNLPRASSHVTEEFWYELYPFAGDGWDSGLMDPDQTPRASYCVLAFGLTPRVAASTAGCNDPLASQDWGSYGPG